MPKALKVLHLVHDVEVPWVFPCVPLRAQGVPCTYPGIASEVVDFLLRAIDVPYNLTYLDSDNRNGQLYEHQLNGTADGVFGLAVATEERQKLYDFSDSVIMDGYGFAVVVPDNLKKGSFLNQAFGMYQIYDVAIWTSLIAMIVAIRLVLKATFQLKDFLKFGRGALLLILTFGLLLLFGLYRSGLLATLLLPHDTLLFDDTRSFIQTLKSGRIQLLVKRDIFYEQYIERAAADEDHLVITSFKQALQRNPPVWIESLRDLELNNTQKVLLTYSSVASYLVTQMCGVRQLRLRALEVPPLDIAYVFPPSFTERQRDDFNGHITFHRTTLEGIVNRYKSLILPNPYVAKREANRTQEPRKHAVFSCENDKVIKRLALLNLSGSYFLLFGGVLGASVVFIIEQIMYRCGFGLV